MKKHYPIPNVLLYALAVFFTASALLLPCRYSLTAAAQAAPEKVILDTDMIDLFDDGMAMLMLAKSEKIDLLGVTCVAGNSWVESGVASALRQLELAGITDVPVYIGINETTRPDRAENIQGEFEQFGRGTSQFVGSFDLAKPADW